MILCRPSRKDGSELPVHNKHVKKYGHVSVTMPLLPSEYALSLRVKNPTYGDWIAYQLGTLCGATKFRAIEMSDFYDSQPHGNVSDYDFSTWPTNTLGH